MTAIENEPPAPADAVVAHGHDEALKAEARRLVEGTTRPQMDATVAVEHIKAELARRQAQRDVLLAEQGRLVTSLMRPAFTYPLAAYYAAVIADSLLQFSWNVAALPPPIGDWSGWIISAIFLSESGGQTRRKQGIQRVFMW